MATARTLYRVTVLLCAALAATASIAVDGRSWSCGRSSRWRVDVFENGGWREVDTELVLTPDGHRNLHLVPDDVLAEYDGPSFWSRHADGKACANHVVKAACVRIPWRDGLRIRVRSAGKLECVKALGLGAKPLAEGTGEIELAPGKLEVVVYKNGGEWARDTIVTTGQVTQLGIESETDSIVSDGEDIAYVNVCVKDKDGNVVPRTRNLVKFSVEGPGFVLATDNGYEADMSDFHASEYRVFNGWVQALVRAKPGAKGLLTVTAASDGLDPVKAKIAVGVKGR